VGEQPGFVVWNDVASVCRGQVEMEELLAAHGSTAALRDMGYRALTGAYAEADDATALRHLTAAAEAGDAVAAFNLGYMHLNGLGARPDPKLPHPTKALFPPSLVKE
jgi:TPR repeat protein